MAGLGRRSHYRKHLTDSVLHELPEPDADDRIAKVVATRGGNLFEVIIASSKDTTKRQAQLAILPTKFHKLVWVKRNDFVICRAGDDTNEGGGGGIRYLITHILYKDQLKHLKEKGIWPIHDEEFNADAEMKQDNATGPTIQDGAREHNDKAQVDLGNHATDDGIVYNEVNDEDYLLNTNRINTMTLQDDSSSSESSSSESEEE